MHINWCNSLGSSATRVQVTHRVFQSWPGSNPEPSLTISFPVSTLLFTLCQRNSLRWIRENSSNQSRTKQDPNSVSVNQCFSLYNFFFQTSAFFVSKSAFRQASFEENKTVFSSNIFFHSNWPDLTAKLQELGPAILPHRKTRCKNGNVEYIRSKWREIIEVVQYCRWYWPNFV